MSMIAEQLNGGTVCFVGAGPGDPELITLKGQRLIAEADVILYAGSLVSEAMLEHARPEAKRFNSAGMPLDQQIAAMREAAGRGERVVRLHTGDPSIYGAIFEQMRQLEALDIPYRIVPGVSSALAAAAALGIEYTVPGDTQTVIFTRLAGRTPVPDREALYRLAAHRSSLVIFLSTGMIARVVDELRTAGYSDGTPVAMVYRASWPDELVLRGTLADIAQQAEANELDHHALIVVSPALDPKIREQAPDSHLYGTAMAAKSREATRAIVTLTRGGTETGHKLLARLPQSILYAPARFVQAAGNIRPYRESVRQVLQSAFEQHEALVCIMAGGIVVRNLAPLLTSKHVDPGVVVLDEAGRFAMSLLSGHQGGANRLAVEVAMALGGQAVLTTSSDVQNLPALDLLGQEWGWQIESGQHLTAASAALVNGDPVGVFQDAGRSSWWPHPTPPNLNPLRLAPGIARRHAGRCSAHHPSASGRQRGILDHSEHGNVPAALPVRGRGLQPGNAGRRGCPGGENNPARGWIVVTQRGDPRHHRGQGQRSGLARRMRTRKVAFAGVLSRRDRNCAKPPHPVRMGAARPGSAGGRRTGRTTGGRDRYIVGRKTQIRKRHGSGRFSIRRGAMKGSIVVVGIGPGAEAHMTPAAREAIETAHLIVGYTTYLRLIEGIAPGVPRAGSGMRREVERVAQAVDQALLGKRVAVISSGDAGVYGMAGLVYEVLDGNQVTDIPVEVAPGVTALNAAAALLGAPLMTDFATISLSDQLVPRAEILKRVELAAWADFVLGLYNPKGKQRTDTFDLTCEILSRIRVPNTPVGIVRAATRAKERVTVTTVADLAQAEVDMLTILIVGNSRTVLLNGKMVTRRGYHQKYNLDIQQTGEG